ncbi:helix-turn-helix transcriptional regulator [Clostridium botulinum]|nr:helix-turn-helix transcriptional regulator [Clostridium botulinum]NFR15801.1 helix-turn-helix transcriptional regulator [Clostridium botulinum]NFR45022.1 helix-turn-helix transcriptional regulator [Clostridium botulinum]NFS51878.1 helix-turn-helix transcriptional regulator [Clostridium botulinum]
MTIDTLFDNRKIVGDKLLEIMKDKGHTKVSFSKLTGISRPTLNNLFKGEIDSKTTFKTHINKIIDTININLDEIVNYNENKSIDNMVVFSNNAPKKHTYEPKAQEMFNILDDILHLCDLYY